MISQGYTRPLLVGALALASHSGAVMAQVSPTSNAQVSPALAAEAVRAVQRSGFARQWEALFASAPAAAVFASLRKPPMVPPSASVIADSVFAGKGANANLRLSTSASAATLQVAPRDWRCDNLEAFQRIRCALGEHEYYVEVAPLQVRDDTALVDVVVFKRRAGDSDRFDSMLCVVRAVPDPGGWRVVKVKEIHRNVRRRGY